MSSSKNKEIQKSKMHPSALLGQIGQIALDKYELGGPYLLIPPLCIENYALGTYYENSTIPALYFIGKPEGRILGTDKANRKFSEINAIRFHATIQEIQPHFLLDSKFVRYLKKLDWMVSVEVQGTNLTGNLKSNEIVQHKNFFYIGKGIFQLFIPGRGFEFEWPHSFKWLKELRTIETGLLHK